MAAPNLVSLTNVKIDTAIGIATTSMADLIAAVTTGHAFNVEAIFCANYHASIAARITVVHKKGGTEYNVIKDFQVPTKQTVNVLLGKPLYLAEGDSVRIVSDTATAITVLAPYADVI